MDPLSDPTFRSSTPPPTTTDPLSSSSFLDQTPFDHNPFANPHADSADVLGSSAVLGGSSSSSSGEGGSDAVGNGYREGVSSSGFMEDDDDEGGVAGSSNGMGGTLRQSLNSSQQQQQHDDDETTTMTLGGASASSSAPIVNPYATVPATPCCNLDKILRTVPPTAFKPLLNSGPMDEQPKSIINIVEAQKLNDMGSSSYIGYIIRTEIPSQNIHLETKRRYSEFEGFQRLLRKMHLTIVVPPIPEKHTVADYAARPGKAKDDPKIIEQRKRMLQAFLNRVAAHPVLGREHVFHRFLEPGVGWTEILTASGLSHHLKKKKTAPTLKITDTLLKNPDPHFLASEDYTYRFGIQLGQLVKHHKKITKHMAELATTGADLGGAYNAWSLIEAGPTAAISLGVEALGEAVDNTVSAYFKLNEIIEEHVTEPLVEYEKLTATIDKILRWRHTKHVDYEQLAEALVSKKNALAKLEASEAESQRLAAVLSAEGTSGPATARAAAQARLQQQQQMESSMRSEGSGGGVKESADESTTVGPGGIKAAGVKPNLQSNTLTTVPSVIGTQATTTKSTTSLGGNSATASGGGIFASFNSFIDNDPETTRRTNISKTKDKIAQLESARLQALSDLGAANEAIQKDLDRFQREKIHDLRNVLLAYAVANRDMCVKGKEAWREAKEAVAGMSVVPQGSGLSSVVTYEKKPLRRRVVSNSGSATGVGVHSQAGEGSVSSV
ncbi:Sorting nexin, cytoplasm-to-vacuole targeting pathway/endosomal sorting [Chytridiales sp. JEL 0842]|nr:Sorting nexin, cytoplasm-to-vacuole targeting pathway/endosomal sorting [Chytridiales sp. JEL 0842]